MRYITWDAVMHYAAGTNIRLHTTSICKVDDEGEIHAKKAMKPPE